ncbi:SDR family NAD(P)-dependent oxidoreductase [Williamsia sp. CHRR-6]|uniref:SDR family NAD(P)-dependent oxidoreductase n=1 Tax=Williamsia sp. CHRR-6 TaxID=2835871 RepID=UPI001BDA4F88|nr:SDR family NAD(P)-dependent oxidoreductase [Williamsia sp. CHRR-6]MBT0565553.1 SDR family NAD(P)-dependent oxidoreductase [Williamsia sp. CHRR-6]
MNTIDRALDTLLDTTVLPGYTKIGSSVRRRFWAPDPPAFDTPVDVVITGAGSGLGAAAALDLARLGARVHLIGRTASRLETTAADIRSTVPGAEVVIRPADLSDLDSVSVLARDLRADLPRIQALVHSAGVMPDSRTLSSQGHESAYATHVLGPVALTAALRGTFDHRSRVVFVSSGGMYPVPLRFTDFKYTQGTYKGMTAYARTKRMQVVITEQLAERLTAPDDPVVHSMHPGWAKTPGVTAAMPGFNTVLGPLLRTASDGADTAVWLAASPLALDSTGKFWHDRRVRPTHFLPWQSDDPTARHALWDHVAAATGVTF